MSGAGAGRGLVPTAQNVVLGAYGRFSDVPAEVLEAGVRRGGGGNNQDHLSASHNIMSSKHTSMSVSPHGNKTSSHRSAAQQFAADQRQLYAKLYGSSSGSPPKRLGKADSTLLAMQNHPSPFLEGANLKEYHKLLNKKAAGEWSEQDLIRMFQKLVCGASAPAMVLHNVMLKRDKMKNLNEVKAKERFVFERQQGRRDGEGKSATELRDIQRRGLRAKKRGGGRGGEIAAHVDTDADNLTSTNLTLSSGSSVDYLGLGANERTQGDLINDYGRRHYILTDAARHLDIERAVAREQLMPDWMRKSSPSPEGGSPSRLPPITPYEPLNETKTFFRRTRAQTDGKMAEAEIERARREMRGETHQASTFGRGFLSFGNQNPKIMNRTDIVHHRRNVCV